MHIRRSDDIIVFSNRKKLNPVTIEQKVTVISQVTGAIMFGTGRFEASILIETLQTKGGNPSIPELREQIAHVLDSVNKDTVAHARVSRDMILFAKLEKPFPRSGKGSVQRRLLLDLYESEITEAYEVQIPTHNEKSLDLLSSDFHVLCQQVLTWIQGHTGRSPPSFEDDLFVLGSGLDSLLVARLSNSINEASGASALSPRAIYSNPTIQGVVKGLLAHRQCPNESLERVSRESRIDRILQEHSQGMTLSPGKPCQLKTNDISVAVIGTTGMLGSYLLDSLIRNESVTRIYCLNRRADIIQLQAKLQKSRSLTSNFDKVSFIRIDLSQKLLGLTPQRQQVVTQHTDVIIHNAWLVNFNLALESFAKDYLYGLRQVIELSTMARKRVSIVFVSSISTIQAWRTPTNKEPSAEQNAFVPEIEHPWSSSLPMGYAESKHVGERLLAQASRTLNLFVSICRVGQIAGPVDQDDSAGEWPQQEWIPSMIKTSSTIKAFPSDLGTQDRVDRIPVDRVSTILAEIATNVPVDASHGLVQYFHVTNPCCCSWADLLPVVITETVGSGVHSKVCFAEWVDKLKVRMNVERTSRASSVDEWDDIPAAKLLDFFDNEVNAASAYSIEHVPRPGTQNARASSETLRAMPTISKEWMACWLHQWGFQRSKDL